MFNSCSCCFIRLRLRVVSIRISVYTSCTSFRVCGSAIFVLVIVNDVLMQSMCRCLDSIKCQVCQLTKANECAKRQRDELCRCNQTYKCRVRELEKDLNVVNSVIDNLRDKVRSY